MDGALNHSGELFPKDAVLVSVFTGFVWRDGPFAFKNTQFSQNYPDSSWLELRLGNNDFAHAAHFLVPFFAVTAKLRCDFTFNRKIHYLTREFHVKLHAKTNRDSCDMGFKVQFNVEFTSQVMDFLESHN